MVLTARIENNYADKMRSLKKRLKLHIPALERSSIAFSAIQSK